MNSVVLQIRDLRVHYRTPLGSVKAIDGVSFDLKANERLGLVGESGSGKSTLVLAILRLTPDEAQIVSGQIMLNGEDLLTLSEEEIRNIRLSQIALVPQGAMNSLNPVMRVKDQMIDGMLDHPGRLSNREQAAHVAHLLEMVGLGRDVLTKYPHELSGGMKQRVCIAIAISLRPMVIIADEPTSALDVVVQKQVMQTLGAIQRTLGASVILVGHDMGLMAQFADRVGVLYAGRLVELGPVTPLFEDPFHPYSRLLITSLPTLKTRTSFQGIPGMPPSLLNPPSGCVFHPRCPVAMPRCSRDIPPLKEYRPGRWAACHLYEEPERVA